MFQGIVHYQPILFASPMKEPRVFLGTLPPPASSSKAHSKQAIVDPNQQEQSLAAKVMLRHALLGTGVIAGGAVRIVLENAFEKQLGSINVARERGIPMEEL
ncbi:paxneb-related protein [Canna indica]|uniref:Paxneb-related protein n=1 Tax=Canna indica TaxID=4628 RepID=A0AAQ3KGY2_9LILI|nr:paxneb-related protein [Canna indica]